MYVVGAKNISCTLVYPSVYPPHLVRFPDLLGKFSVGEPDCRPLSQSQGPHSVLYLSQWRGEWGSWQVYLHPCSVLFRRFPLLGSLCIFSTLGSDPNNKNIWYTFHDRPIIFLIQCLNINIREFDI